MTITLDVQSIFSFVIGALFVGFGVFIVFMLWQKIKNAFASREFTGDQRQRMQQQWREIEQLLAAPGDVSRKLAVLEADKLLDQALKAMTMPGATLGERLKFAEYKYPQIREVWWAHRIRNQLAHESTYHLDAGMARRAVQSFKKTLQTLGAL